MKIRPVSNLGEIAAWKQAYLRSLSGPMDGYWETAVIGLAPHYEMIVDGERVGYFTAQDNQLLQFFVTDSFLPQAAQLFDELLLTKDITQASVSTVEPTFLTLCLDRQTAVTIHSYLFQDHHQVQLTLPTFPNAHFRSAVLADLVQLIQFYHENNEYEDTEAIEKGSGGHEPYARELIINNQVFLLMNDDEILGIGECRKSETQKPFANIGMITAKQYRQKGIGTFLLAQLKDYCYSQLVKPICSCVFDNIASRKTIEKAGFISQHRILNNHFN